MSATRAIGLLPAIEPPTVALLRRIRELERLLVETGRPGHCELPAERAPDEIERAAFRARADAIDAGLHPTGRINIQGNIAALLAGYPGGRAHHAPLEVVMVAYVAAVADLPEWSVIAACRHWNRGEAGGYDSRFAPAPPELRAVALALVQPAKDERATIVRILSAAIAPAVDERMRAATRARVEEIRAAFHRRSASDHLADLKTAENATPGAEIGGRRPGRGGIEKGPGGLA